MSALHQGIVILFGNECRNIPTALEGENAGMYDMDGGCGKIFLVKGSDPVFSIGSVERVTSPHVRNLENERILGYLVHILMICDAVIMGCEDVDTIGDSFPGSGDSGL